jgi:hypothetical protein
MPAVHNILRPAVKEKMPMHLIRARANKLI